MKIIKIIFLLSILGMLSCKKNGENKPLTLQDKISIRDSIAAEKISQMANDQTIKDTISGVWKAGYSHDYELFSITLENTKNRDSIKGTYRFTLQDKPEEGIITGIISQGKAIIEFYNPSNPSAHKGKAILSDWTVDYKEMNWELIKPSEQPSIPETCIFHKPVPLKSIGRPFMGKSSRNTK
ncbi:hypothetical protein [Chryseobacterium jejuense]|uniref:Lipoprotein n=1 Tax=Chryseobacterium jejuense TaxID=445960 RepID=A0A2X2X743_CHRJE|nr:hypothetical protein [Chryseobacterium jejuense]SDI15594.1 hypothetical protein SAMN05421542_0252 [Chryseobacterium jejuense]SQB46521.1 Uncharacterised protein [Chryseobacterium jejuense]